MASRSAEDLCCHICHYIFRDPVLLPCSHSFCNDCVSSGSRECPVCESISSKYEQPVSLKNLCEVLIQEQRQSTSEKLELFCLEHQQALCLTCWDFKANNNHDVRPISEAAQDHKKKLQRILKLLQKHHEVLKRGREYCNEREEKIKVQAQHIGRQIKQEVKRLHIFLEQEEESRISALREEEEQNIKLMRKTTQTLSEEIAVLSDIIRATEEGLKAEDAALLQNYKATVKRLQQHPLMGRSELDLGFLIDMTEHLGNLRFNIWHKMQIIALYIPVILDPATAVSPLCVSDDLTFVRCEEKENFPENREDLDHFPAVLGSDALESGCYSWEIEVEDSEDWEVGVISESALIKQSIDSGFWGIRFSNDKYSTRSPADPVTELDVQTKLQRITVSLDCDQGELSFFASDTLIHTFTDILTKKMFPYISTLDELRILPSVLDLIKHPPYCNQ